MRKPLALLCERSVTAVIACCVSSTPPACQPLRGCGGGSDGRCCNRRTTMPKASKTLTPLRSSKTKTSQKSAPAKRSSRSKPAGAAKASRTRVTQATAPIERSGSKQSLVLGMLRGAKGASVASIMTATGWQPHSVRGFFAGVVRKKLKLNLTSEPSEDGRIYRIAEEGAVAAAGAVTSRRAAA